jgi:Ethanolamine utilization protein
MNIFIAIMLFFAFIGFVDKIFHLKWKLSSVFDKGLLTMGSLTLSILGIYCISMTFVQGHIKNLTVLNQYLFFDASLFVGALLSPDMGGYPIVSEICQNSGLIIFYGVLLTSVLGQTISFQLPVFLSFLETNEIDHLMKGFVFGIMMIPLGMLFSFPFLHISFSIFIKNLLPVIIFCLSIAVFIMKCPQFTIKVLRWFANIIKALSYIFFLIVMIGLYFPSLQYVEESLVLEGLLMVLKMVIIVCGSMVLSELVLKFGSQYIQKIADFLQVNKESVIGLILNCASSLAMLPLYSKMDRKGKLLNAAFSVSGAYVFGGQLGFIAGVSAKSVTVYVIVKLMCGLLSIAFVHFVDKKISI